jgi:hypothetical protein
MMWPTAEQLHSVATLVIVSLAAGTSALAHCCPAAVAFTHAVFA